MAILRIVLAAALLQTQSWASDLTLEFRHGTPVADRETAWERHVEFASWVDNDHIVFARRDGSISCVTVSNDRVAWAHKGVGEISDWAVSGTSGVAAVLTRERVILLLDTTDGKVIRSWKPMILANLIGESDVLPRGLALATDGRLFICDYATTFGRNGYIIAKPYDKLTGSFRVDASPKQISLSPDCQRIAVVAAQKVLSIRHLTSDDDVFLRGKRATQELNTLPTAIDAPFVSHIRDSGGTFAVYTVDNSWATGGVHVLNLATHKEHSFDSENGHVEIDVLFKQSRIALTGTSTDLTIVDLDGQKIARKKNATLQRNSCVQFSPSRDRVLVGSWDTTLSVFKIVDNGE